MTEQPSSEPPPPRSSQPKLRPVVAQLHRLGRAANAADVVRALESLRPSLGPNYRIAQLGLPSLTALAEAHLRERREPGRDPLTGLLDAKAFADIVRAHAERARAIEGGADPSEVLLRVAIVTPAPPAGTIQILARTCAEWIAEGDYLGRTHAATISVLPRSGGLRGARVIAARLAEACRSAFAALRLEITLEDLAGRRLESLEVVIERRSRPV
jgi:hypothetical protein